MKYLSIIKGPCSWNMHGLYIVIQFRTVYRGDFIKNFQNKFWRRVTSPHLNYSYFNSSGFQIMYIILQRYVFFGSISFSWILTKLKHDDVINWKHFPRYWPFVCGIHRSPVNSPHKDQWRGVLMFSLICAWINGWVNNRESDNLRRHCAHYDVIVMDLSIISLRIVDECKRQWSN